VYDKPDKPDKLHQLHKLVMCSWGENAYAQRRRIHEKRHRDAIQGKRQEEQDR
jgi:hypothetical protein